MKKIVGKVTSNKMTGVVAVEILRLVTHPIYKKQLRRSKRFLARAEGSLNIGDQVEIKEIRPQSKRVRFAVVNIVRKTEVLPEVKEEKMTKEKRVKAKVKEEKSDGPTA